MEWTFLKDGPVTARIELAAGLVEASLDAGEEIGVSLEALRERDERAAALIASAEVWMSGSVLTVRVPKRELLGSELHLRVSIPAGSSVDASTASAVVRVGGSAAGIDVQTASGDIAVGEPCGRLKAATASGDILCAAVTGEADVRTASGDFLAESIGGEASIRTASGEVRLGSLHATSRIKTASGDVRVGAASIGHVSVGTVSGDITVGVAPGVATFIDLSSVSGETSCTLPAEQQPEDGAELSITCQTVSGHILIRASESVSL